MNTELSINLVYLVSTFLFIVGLKLLGHPSSARKGNLLSAAGMILAGAATLFHPDITNYTYIAIALSVGTVVGIASARLVAMTSMPEMVALLNGFGGISSLLVGWSAVAKNPAQPIVSMITVLLSILIGGITFTGSLIAFAKLKELMPGRPLTFLGQKFFNVMVLIVIVAGSLHLFIEPIGVAAGLDTRLLVVLGLSLLFGILVVIPIGGADMPVVISLLNSLSGIAACAAGFVIQNNLLIVAGALVGASGVILTNIMCKSMNRTLGNVLFGSFGKTSGGSEVEGEVKPINAEDTYLILEAAQSVCVVPGYGLAVAQAQHVVRELGELLEDHGCEVKYAIHPVAGRMPGHMNVLLAEAGVDYEQLVEMDDINPQIENIDVVMVIGANDVVNPAARDDSQSAIYGMPIINVDKAKTCIVLKRSMGTGFAGIQNPLFFKENTRMLFGDAKSSVSGLVAEFKE